MSRRKASAIFDFVFMRQCATVSIIHGAFSSFLPLLRTSVGILILEDCLRGHEGPTVRRVQSNDLKQMNNHVDPVPSFRKTLLRARQSITSHL